MRGGGADRRNFLRLRRRRGFSGRLVLAIRSTSEAAWRSPRCGTCAAYAAADAYAAPPMAPPMQRAPSGRLHGAASSAKAGLKRQASAGLSRAKSSARSLYSSSRKPTMERRPIKLLVLTWNVGNAAPDFAELAQWLPVLGGDFDLVAVGTQENDGYDKGPKKKSIFSHSASALVGAGDPAAARRRLGDGGAPHAVGDAALGVRAARRRSRRSRSRRCASPRCRPSRRPPAPPTSSATRAGSSPR